MSGLLGDLAGVVRAAVGGRDWPVIAFGAIGVGNLHVNVLGPAGLFNSGVLFP